MIDPGNKISREPCSIDLQSHEIYCMTNRIAVEKVDPVILPLVPSAEMGDVRVALCQVLLGVIGTVFPSRGRDS